jgi:hypothetical protein
MPKHITGHAQRGSGTLGLMAFCGLQCFAHTISANVRVDDRIQPLAIIIIIIIIIIIFMVLPIIQQKADTA